MYIRRTQTRSNATGERYYTYRLVRAERIQNKVRQVTPLNLGRHFAVDQALWPALCQRIEALTTGQSYLLEPDLPKAASAEAERIAAQLLARTSVASSLSVASAGTKQSEHADVQAVDVNSLELVRSRSVGVEQIVLWAMQQIGFTELFHFYFTSEFIIQGQATMDWTHSRSFFMSRRVLFPSDVQVRPGYRIHGYEMISHVTHPKDFQQD